MRGAPGRLLITAATVALCAAGDQPESVVLARFQEKFRQDLAHLPNYTCLETIKRSERRSASRPFTPLDTIRLEVSTADGKEIYAWPGARQFEDKELKAFITSGATAAGLLFSAVPKDVFVSGNAALEYRGQEDLDGRRAVRYDYRVPRAYSGFKIRARNDDSSVAEVVALKGSFWFDPASLDLVRLDTFGEDMPKSLDLAEAMVRILYARTEIGGAGVLLPQRSEVTLTHLSGAADHNAVEFSQCRVYQTESSISFEPPAVDAGAPKPGIRDVVLPPGLLVQVVMETAIDSKTIALGDAVRARVRDDVRRGGEVVLPAGAVIDGRIRRLERQTAVSPYFVLGVELFEVSWGNTRADFYGQLVESYDRKGIKAGYGARGTVTYILAGKSFHIEPGLGLLWRILDRRASPAQQEP